jgi:hypothetical protein
MNELTLRLNHEPLPAEAAAQDLDDGGRLLARYTSLQAQKKALEEQMEDVKNELKALLDDGELVSTGAYFATYQENVRETFDWKKAAQNGLFTEEQARPFMKSTLVKSLVVKRHEEVQR